MPIREHKLDFEGIEIYCYEGGTGAPILLLHGSGPGTASASNWSQVIGPLSAHYHVLAVDLVGYGNSGRKGREPYFDMPLWVRQARFSLDRLSRTGSVGIIAHSLGGAIALRVAAADRRVKKLFLQGSLGAKAKLNKALKVAWSVPKDAAAFRAFYESVIKVRAEITDDFIQDRLAIMRKDGYDKYFAKMFAGDKQRYLDQAAVPKALLKKLKCDVFMLYGASDTCVPFETDALSLANALPQADLVRLADCGHPCSIEEPKKFVHLARGFFG